MTGIHDRTDRPPAGGRTTHRAGNGGKTSFDDIYDRPDPRAYCRGLGPLEYQTPRHAQPVFRRLLGARTLFAGEGREGPEEPEAPKEPGGPVTVLDVCCSYGINAALLRHDVTLDDLYRHYTDPRVSALSTEELIEEDRAFYAGRRSVTTPARVIGLDAARNAVLYARAAGLLDEGFGEDLERHAPGPALARALEPVQLITVTGGVGYITSRTFEKVLSHVRAPVWVAAFVLRTVDYGPIVDTLAGFGLVTHKATSHTFPQRRFSDETERRHAIEAVTAAGHSPEGKEAEGYYHTELYLSRPSSHADAFPIEDVLDGR
ncbi:hypothetical protein [Streptomyces sp. 8N706]|uniref:hypothetical protein n=1 Tax=Streptomyces sp. 8N706 TaxID=3457416 RepID=UPI003FD33948